MGTDNDSDADTASLVRRRKARRRRQSEDDSTFTETSRRHRRPRQSIESVGVQVQTRRKPGHSASDPISIDSDDEPPSSHVDDGAALPSKIAFTKQPLRIVWNVEDLTWGGKPYGFSIEHPHPMTVTFTNEAFEFKPHDNTFPGICVTLRDRPKPFDDIACNTFHSPCFIAFKPSARGIVGLSSTDTRSYTDVDHRYFVLYFTKADDSRSVLVRDTMAKLSVKVDSVIRELNPEELSRFDCIYPRPGRGKTRSATQKTRQESSFTRALNAKKPILQYPMHTATGNRITLTEDDLDVLDPGSFLNDSIVDFYLLYLKDQVDCARFHIFNSFFYKKYTSAGAAPHSGPADCYRAVKNWTRNVALFEKDFLIMPVCDRMHWSCVIACHPGLLAREAAAPDPDSPVFPCIILLDSLGSHSGPKLFRMFRHYLTSEWNATHTASSATGDVVECLRITPTNMPGIVVQVPQQTNDCDCGLFMLQYIEQFLADPFADFRKPQIHNPTWFEPESVVKEKRDALRKLLLRLSAEWKSPQKTGDAPEPADDQPRASIETDPGAIDDPISTPIMTETPSTIMAVDQDPMEGPDDAPIMTEAPVAVDQCPMEGRNDAPIMTEAPVAVDQDPIEGPIDAPFMAEAPVAVDQDPIEGRDDTPIMTEAPVVVDQDPMEGAGDAPMTSSPASGAMAFDPDAVEGRDDMPVMSEPMSPFVPLDASFLLPGFSPISEAVP